METTQQLAIVEGDTDVVLKDWTVTQFLQWAAQSAPDTIALAHREADPANDRSWTYTGLLQASARLAAVLRTKFRPGEHLALCCGNSAEWIIFQYAIARAGLVLVSVNPGASTEELAYMLQKCKVAGMVLDRVAYGVDLVDRVSRIRSDLPLLRELLVADDWENWRVPGVVRIDFDLAKPSDPALIIFTSGTTGRPKAVVLHHAAIVNSGIMSAKRSEVRQGSATLGVIPAYHVGGSVLTHLGAAALLGPLVMIAPRFEPGLAGRLMVSERIGWVPGVPALLIKMLESCSFNAMDMLNSQAIYLGGTIVNPETANLVSGRTGADVILSYGQSEGGGVISTTLRNDVAGGRGGSSVGVPLEHTTIKISDLYTGATVAPGVVGEIRLRSPYMTTGYFDDPAATSALFDSEGFLCTGDLGLVQDQRIHITGRLKEMIIRGGENIYPREIEDVLCSFAGIAETAVIGVPDDVMGEEVAVAIRCTPGAQVDVDEARAYLRERVARYKVPRYWRIVDDFPRSSTGKIVKSELKNRLEWTR